MLSALGEYDVVGEAKDGREACQLAISLAPDLGRIDIHCSHSMMEAN